MDQAIGYYGRHIEAELDKASSEKPSKGERRAKEAREKKLKELLADPNDDKPVQKQFADPAVFFK